jgi:hypothetical protein
MDAKHMSRVTVFILGEILSWWTRSTCPRLSGVHLRMRASAEDARSLQEEFICDGCLHNLIFDCWFFLWGLQHPHKEWRAKSSSYGGDTRITWWQGQICFVNLPLPSLRGLERSLFDGRHRRQRLHDCVNNLNCAADTLCVDRSHWRSKMSPHTCSAGSPRCHPMNTKHWPAFLSKDFDCAMLHASANPVQCRNHRR